MAELIGQQASVTFAGAEMDTELAAAGPLYGAVIDCDIQIVLDRVDRWGDVAPRYVVVAVSDGTITIGGSADSMTPVVPIGTPAVLVVFVNTAGTKKWTCTNAILVRYSHATRPIAAQKWSATFRPTATGTAGTNPIVAS